MVNISVNTNIRDIGSIDSRQAKNKVIKSALRNHTKFSQPDTTTPSPNVTEYSTEDELMFKTSIKNQLRDAVQAFKNPR